MTRFPRAIQAAQNKARGIRERVSARKNGKALVYLGAGLALAGAGAATAGGLFAATASTPGLGASVHGAGSPAAASHRHFPARHPITQKASDDSKTAKGSRLVVPRAGHKQAVSQRGAAQHGAANSLEAAAPHVEHAESWSMIAHMIAAHTSPTVHQGSLPAQDRLMPAGVSGPQMSMPMTQTQYANASTIVHQAIDKKMGLRSAVIAVATAMQESMLQNINYGTSDSVGLFQQRPSMGWGSVNQIMHPVYAADAFLKALRTYQANNPAWAHQPLWQSAQGVQNSGFPTAYAKWEAQAANIVGSVARKMISPAANPPRLRATANPPRG